MKETVLDVLIYLFEHCFDADSDIESDQDSLKGDLVEAGFPEAEVSKAFAWLESLAAEPEATAEVPESRPSTRVFSREEAQRLDVECRGFLLFLEQSGVLDGVTRERVIDRVMALETQAIDLEELKWVVLMVLFNQPGNESAFSWMEDFVFDEVSDRLH